MKVLVCGSRHFEDYERLKREVLRILPIGNHMNTIVISGHARGADSLGERLAKDMEFKCEIYPADWNTYGKRAGPIRNSQMLKEGKPDLVIAFRGPNSRGTQNMITQARKARVPVEIIDIEES